MSKSKRKQTTPALITLHRSRDIPLNNIALSPSNVRSIFEKAEIEDLAESIAARGLIQGLNVRPILDADGNETGTFEVPAGGRRFRALMHLVKQKRLAPDTLVPCVVKTDGLAEDDSLAENSDRANLHPIDEFKAFAAMIDKGRSVDDTAASYRVTPAFVRQRLRLASASPVLLKAFADEQIDLNLLMAYCVVDDHKRQEAVYKSFSEGLDYSHYALAVKRKLTEQTVSANDERAVFVGLKAYTDAGGTILRDLFDEDHEGYLQDPALLDELVDQKLSETKQDMIDKGWKWAEAAVSIPYSRKLGLDRLIPFEVPLTKKEQKSIDKLEAEREAIENGDGPYTDEESERLDAIEKKIDAIQNKPPVFDTEDMARAGVFLSLDDEGAISIDYGFIKPDDVVQDASVADSGDGDNETGRAGGSVDNTDAGDSLKPLSDRLILDLTAYRTVALRNALAQDFEVAFLVVLHTLALSHFYHRSAFSCVELKVTEGFPATAEGLDTWGATKSIDKRDAEWRKQLPEHPRDLWAALSAFQSATRQALFAHCASFSVNAVKLSRNSRNEEIRHADQLQTALGMHMAAAGWTTTAKNYLSRVSKPHILDAVREAKGLETASLIEHLKKEQMANEAERLLQGTGWLPAAMRDTSEAAEVVSLADTEDLPAFLTDGGEDEAAVA